MTPGTYIRLRREAAGLSIADVAILISPSTRWARFNALHLDLLEQDAAITVAEGFLRRLRSAFTFDPYLYLQIRDGRQPSPAICRVCGCSDLDACDDEILGPCGWAAEDLCTACESHPAAGSSAGLSTGE